MIFPFGSSVTQDIYLHELVIRLVFDFLEIVQCRAIIQAVQIHNLVLGVFVNQQGHHMRCSYSEC